MATSGMDIRRGSNTDATATDYANFLNSLASLPSNAQFSVVMSTRTTAGTVRNETFKKVGSKMIHTTQVATKQ